MCFPCFRVLLFLVCSVVVFGAGVPERPNIGLGCKYSVEPTPTYSSTSNGGTDSTDLTDGQISERKDNAIWLDKRSVAWSYVPIISISLDLGKNQPIGEVCIRLLGGSPQPGMDFPGSVRVLASSDGISYYNVASYSKWISGDDLKYGIPKTEGKAWVHNLRFTNLNIFGRFVALQISGSSLTCSDELTVIRGTGSESSFHFDSRQLTDFSLSKPQVVFFKPELVIAEGALLPVPIGLIDGSRQERELAFCMEIPRKLDCALGLGGDYSDGQLLETIAGEMKTVRISSKVKGQSSLPWKRLFFKANFGKQSITQIRYWLEWGNEKSPSTTIPVRTIVLKPLATTGQMIYSLGWWPLTSTMGWPGALTEFNRIGINTVSAMGMWMKEENSEVWNAGLTAKKSGFKLLNIDLTWHDLVTGVKIDHGVNCQLEGGKFGNSLCPSYRGEQYYEELKRLANQCARMKADYLFSDIELWDWRGPVDCEKCKRCSRDKEMRKIATWTEWKDIIACEMWNDLYGYMQKVMRPSGGKDFEIGSYDWRPSLRYQQFWPFDKLYEKRKVAYSNICLYTSLLPYHIELIGDEVKKDRSRLRDSSVVPWLCSGDAGMYSAEAFRCALLECFLNGAKGILLWSNRYLDSETLIGYNEAISSMQKVEKLVLEGKPFLDANVQGAGHVSGMVYGQQIALLIGEYQNRSTTAVDVLLTIPFAGEAVDCDSGMSIARIKANVIQKISVKLGTHRSCLLLIKPESTITK